MARRRRARGTTRSVRSPPACVICCSRSAMSARRSSGTRSAAGSRCSSPISFPSSSNAWCSSRAGVSVQRSAWSCARLRCPARIGSSPRPPGLRAPPEARSDAAYRPSGCGGSGCRRGRARLRVARRLRASCGVPRHVARGHQGSGSKCRRHRPAVPRRSHAGAHRLGRPRPDHPRPPR
jgi:hypothetical protein